MTSRKKHRLRPPDPELRNAVLDLHEPIAEIRALSELVLVLCEHREPIPTPVLGCLWRLLSLLDQELREGYEVLRASSGITTTST